MRVFYSVGCERSGNTMFARLLMQHPDILVLAEVKFLQTALLRHADDLAPTTDESGARLWNGLRRALVESPYLNFDSDWNRLTKSVLSTAVERAANRPGRPGFAALVDEICAAATTTGARAVVLCEPSMVYFLPELEAACPDRDFGYLHVLRDGIAVANSIDKVHTMPSGDFEPAMRWKRAVKAWHDFTSDFPGARTHEVRYERLVDAAVFEPTMRDVYGFLDVPHSVHRGLSPLMSRENFEGTASTVPEPQTTPMTIDERVAGCVLAGELARTGYARDIEPLPDDAVLALRLSELDYWLRVREEVSRGQLAAR